MESVDFLVGEKKRVSISVKSIRQVPFEITDARFSLRCGEDEEVSGNLVVEPIRKGEVLLSALVQPQRANTLYDLEFSYEIYPETYLHYVKVRVGTNEGVYYGQD